MAKAWYSYEEEVFSCLKEQENFSNLILIQGSFFPEVLFGKVGSKIKLLGLSRKGVDKKKK